MTCCRESGLGSRMIETHAQLLSFRCSFSLCGPHTSSSIIFGEFVRRANFSGCSGQARARGWRRDPAIPLTQSFGPFVALYGPSGLEVTALKEGFIDEAGNAVQWERILPYS